MKIENLLQTIGTAVQESYRAIEQSSVDQFFSGYFDQEAKNSEAISFKPKMIEVEIPNPYSNENAGRVVYTPIATLVQHKNMNIDYIKLNLNIDVIEETDESLDISTQNNQNNSGNEKAGVLEITFKCSDTPEGVSRIETQLNSLI